ncbi:hypothetical protein HYS31_02910 [Candidatus Woesearchaeota archaeon]|nr:hypothetical protein [Candidatus Woesearchaeota archaeon]
MQKKEAKAEESKGNKPHNWTAILVVLIIAIVFLLVFMNNYSSGTGSVVRGSGSKKPDLIASGATLQHVQKKLIEDKLFFHLQEGVGVANMGGARSKASVLRAGITGDSLQNVRATVSYLDSTGKLVTSATTQYLTLTNNGVYIDIPVDTLMPYDKYKWGDSYAVLFLDVPINMPPPDGTVTETRFTLFGDADVTKVVTESDEINNYIEQGYIFRCAFQNDDLSVYPYAPTCCLHRVDPLTTRYIMYGTYYCEDFPPYDPLYVPASG